MRFDQKPADELLMIEPERKVDPTLARPDQKALVEPIPELGVAAVVVVDTKALAEIYPDIIEQPARAEHEREEEVEKRNAEPGSEISMTYEPLRDPSSGGGDDGDGFFGKPEKHEAAPGGGDGGGGGGPPGGDDEGVPDEGDEGDEPRDADGAAPAAAAATSRAAAAAASEDAKATPAKPAATAKPAAATPKATKPRSTRARKDDKEEA